jgi:hypothetical protein
MNLNLLNVTLQDQEIKRPIDQSTMRTFVLTVACALPLVTLGFAPLGNLQKPTGTSIARSSRQQIRQHIVPPEHVDFLNVAFDSFQQHSLLLADATDASAAVVEEVAEAGLWQKYLDVFKGILIFVHSTIDEPLRSQGITQTWGISIAIFTAGE